MERGIVTRRRLRHELARAILTTNDDSVVQAFMGVTPAVFSSRDPEADLMDASEFVEMYTDLDEWAERVADCEEKGVVALCRALQQGENEATEQGKALFAKAPSTPELWNEMYDDEQGNASEAAPAISSNEDFRKTFVTADYCHISRHEATAGIVVLLQRPDCQRVRQQILMEVTGSSHEVEGKPKIVALDHPILAEECSEPLMLISPYALFPGWPKGKTISMRDFIAEWLVEWLMVPLSEGGQAWIQVLAPSLIDVEVGGLKIECVGVSHAQQAMLAGQNDMTIHSISNHALDEACAFGIETAVSRIRTNVNGRLKYSNFEKVLLSHEF